MNVYNDHPGGGSEAPPESAPSGASTLRYAVIACGQEWRVLSGRAQIGHFETRAEALALAINLTKAALAEGHEAELLAQPGGPDIVLLPLFST